MVLRLFLRYINVSRSWHNALKSIFSLVLYSVIIKSFFFSPDLFRNARFTKGGIHVVQTYWTLPRQRNIQLGNARATVYHFREWHSTKIFEIIGLLYFGISRGIWARNQNGKLTIYIISNTSFVRVAQLWAILYLSQFTLLSKSFD